VSARTHPDDRAIYRQGTRAVLLIENAADSGGLLFYERQPDDRAKSMEGFWIRITGQNLLCAGQVYTGVLTTDPAGLFAELARQWTGEISWVSLEGELALRCRHDRRGHISIQIDLRSGPMPHDWRVVATVMAEAGQLDRIAQKAVAFFG
jgi:hypothetical protein